MLIINIALLLLGVFFLIKGSGVFVGASSHIARKLGVSNFIIGLTLVAFGTSLPELTSSIVASVAKISGLVLGTIIGANVANLTLIVGTSSILKEIKIEKEILRRDGYVLFSVILILFLFLFDLTISRIEGVVFILLYFSYMFFLIESKSKLKEQYDFADFAKYFIQFGYLKYLKKGIFLKFSRKRKKKKKNNLLKYYFLIIIGLILVFVSAELVVKKAVDIAEYFSLAPIVIGVLISIGTTLPELSVSVSASSPKYGNVAIGNAIGSCITNTLLILGIASVINPLEILKESMLLILPFLGIATLLLLFFIKTKLKLSKKEGFFLLSIYVAFLASVLLFN